MSLPARMAATAAFAGRIGRRYDPTGPHAARDPACLPVGARAAGAGRTPFREVAT